MRRYHGLLWLRPIASLLLVLLVTPAGASAQSSVSGWGFNGTGCLGDNTGIDHTFAVEAQGITTAVAITGGLDFSVAVLADGTVHTWGLGEAGQLGDGLLVSSLIPVAVPGLAGITAAAAGGAHVLALRSDGSVWAWGDNSSGELGDGTTTQQPLPVAVVGLPTDIVAVGCGRTHSFAVTAAGEVWAWGQNAWGQLGDGSTTDSVTPIALAGLPPIVAIDGGTSLGIGFTVALAADGSVWTWGGNNFGQLGNETEEHNPTPAPVPGIDTAVAAVAGMDFAMALLSDGTVLAWGGNAYGELGDGTTTDSSTPSPVMLADGVSVLSDVTAIAAGLHGLALHGNGQLSAWGYNFYGQVGDGGNADRTLADDVHCMSGVTQIAAADYHSMALGDNACATSTAAPQGATATVTRLTATRWSQGSGQAEVAFEMAQPERSRSRWSICGAGAWPCCGTGWWDPGTGRCAGTVADRTARGWRAASTLCTCPPPRLRIPGSCCCCTKALRHRTSVGGGACARIAASPCPGVSAMSKAMRVYATGGPEVLRWEEVEVPAPGPGQALIRHRAVGVNFIDVYHRSGLYPVPLPFTVGSEGAGVVDAIGPGVTEVAVGDRVAYAAAPIGSYAEQRLIPSERLVRLPRGIDEELAASIMLKGMTAWYLIRRTYPVQPGDTVLMHAAAGGVGLLLCQWAKALGARVIGTVGSPEKAQLAAAHGCDDTILYREQDVAAEVHRLTNGAKLPVVYDGVGKDTFMTSLDCLAPRGLMASFGNASGAVEPISIRVLAQKGSLFLTRPTLHDYVRRREDLLAAAEELFEVVSNGSVRVDVRRAYPLKEAAQAHRDLESRRTTGSIVLVV